jgi:uracil-DNA glycosylase
MKNLSSPLTEKLSWQEMLLDNILKKPNAIKLREFIARQRIDEEVFPEQHEVFRIYKDLQPSDVHVVILGFDPYIISGVSDGYAYSSKKMGFIPRVLDTIIKEIYLQHQKKYYSSRQQDGRLDGLVNQGVFLLNRYLTSVGPKSRGHKQRGWEDIIDATMEILGSKNQKPTVFLLWGKELQAFSKFIDQDVHLIIKNNAPGGNAYHKKSKNKFSQDNTCFLEANIFLKKNGRQEIDWLSFNPTEF